MKNSLMNRNDHRKAAVRPFQSSFLGKEYWRDPRKKSYKTMERFLGLRRVLLPLLLIAATAISLLLNYIFSLPDALKRVFAQGIFQPPDWKQVFNVEFFFRFPRTKDGWLLFLIIWGLLSLLFGLKIYKMRRGYMPLEETLTAATSRWADPTNELDHQYQTMATDNLDNYSGTAGVIVGTAPRTKEDLEKNRVREYLSDEPANTVVVGETRVGKGVFGIEKALDGFSRTTDVRKKKSLFIHDPSGELYLKWKKLLEIRGYKVYLLNLVDTAISDSTNPLTLIIHYYKKYLFADKQANRDRGLDQVQAEIASLCYSYFYDENAKEPIWQDSASALFSAAALSITEEALLTEKPELANLYTLINMVSSMNAHRILSVDDPYLIKSTTNKKERELLFQQYKDKTALDFYFGRLPIDHPAHIAYEAILASAPAKATIGNVITHFLTKMKAFIRTGNAKLTALNTINFMDSGFGKRPTAVFVVVSDQDPSNHAIAANFFDQSFKELHKVGLRTPERKLPREIVYVFEEVGNMVMIPNLATKVTDGLKVGISHFFVLQNFEQLNKYGESNADTIIANCGNVIVVKTKSKKTREMILDDLGDRANLSLSRQGKVIESEKIQTESVERIPMMTKDSLARMPFGETIVVRSMKTHDLKGNVIKDLYPIYNHEDTRMLESWKYLPYDKYTSTWDEIEGLYAAAAHVNINLSSLLYQVKVEEIPYKEQRREAVAQGRPFVLPDPARKRPATKRKPKKTTSSLVEPSEINSQLQALDERFNACFSFEVQQQSIAERLKVTFLNKIAREVRGYYQQKPRIVAEFDTLRQTGTIQDLRDWLSNVGREPLYNIIIEIIEKERGRVK